MAKTIANFYAVLGVNSSATPDEIRRAYRVLARRYHPDLNPEAASADKFKLIAEAYHILSDGVRRKQYDLETELNGTNAARGAAAYRSAPREGARERFERSKFENFGSNSGIKPEGVEDSTHASNRAPSKPGAALFATIARFFRSFRSAQTEVKPAGAVPNNLRAPKSSTASAAAVNQVTKISIIEVSLSIRDAVFGVKKSVEIAEPEGMRKLSVRIPAGVRNGSLVRLRAKGTPGEELVLIVRVAAHPFIRVEAKGLIMEVPITVNEAISGASITVPTLEDAVAIKIQPGAQSGQEVRLKGKGIHERDGGERGDLFVRLMIRVPECIEAYGIRDRAAELDKYFERNVRAALPTSLTEI